MFEFTVILNTCIYARKQEFSDFCTKEQKILGKVINEVPVPDGRQMDFSSEIGAGRNTGRFDPFLMMYNNPGNDPLGYYDAKAGKMVPVFTVANIQSKKPPFYSYMELPRHFIGMYAPGMEETQTDAQGNTSATALPPVNFIVDKKTLQGAAYSLVVDELGGLAAGNNFSQGYYIANWSAIRLKTQLEELIASGKVEDPDAMKRATDLNDSITEEDNNVIFIAPLKK